MRAIRNNFNNDGTTKALQSNKWNEPNVVHLYFEIFLNGELIARYGRDDEERATNKAASTRSAIYACNYEGWQCRPGSAFETPPLIKELLYDFSKT
jgi:hypothetical protein